MDPACRVDWAKFQCDTAAIPDMYRAALDMYDGPVDENGKIQSRHMLQAIWYEIVRPGQNVWRKNYMNAVLLTLLCNMESDDAEKSALKIRRRDAWVQFVHSEPDMPS